MDVRTRILLAAADLLAESLDGDVSVRAVCEAAAVAPPAVYRLFGDKAGLLGAVVDHAYEQYLASKRAMHLGADPVADLYAGWDNHVAFALERPNFYQLMWAPGLSAPPGAAAEAHRMLEAVLERCAAAGRLTVSPLTATAMIMSANVGVALSLVSRPSLYPDLSVSGRVRDAVVGAVTTASRRRHDDDRADDADGEDRHFYDRDRSGKEAVPVAASVTQVGSWLRAAPPAALTPHETALLLDWLARIADSPPSGYAPSGREASTTTAQSFGPRR